MFKTTFFILLFAYILGYYYFIRDEIVNQKSKSIVCLLKQFIINELTFFVITFLVFNIPILYGCVLPVIGYFLIDLLKLLYINSSEKKNNFDRKKERIVYIAGQVLHLIIIAITAFTLVRNNYSIKILPFINLIFKTIGIPKSIAFTWLLVLLIIWKPTNLTIKKLIHLHKPQSEEKLIEKSDEKLDENAEEMKTGGFIGLLERLLILVLLYTNQYSAIGLVLTAKSIARYDKITKEKEFAEYYLLGTLLSTLFVILTYLIVF